MEMMPTESHFSRKPLVLIQVPHRKYIEHGARNYSEKTSFSAFPVRAIVGPLEGFKIREGASSNMVGTSYRYPLLEIVLTNFSNLCKSAPGFLGPKESCPFAP